MLCNIVSTCLNSQPFQNGTLYIIINKYVLSRCTLHVRGGFLLLLNCCILDNIIQYRHF